MIIKYTNPPQSLLVKGVDLTSATVYVTVKQGDTEINRTGAQLTMSYANEDTTITFSLTQAETGSFDSTAYSEVQVNYIIGGVRYATTKAVIKIGDNLYDEVIA